MFLRKNILLFIILTIIVFASQFILAKKHLEYGFNNDDWYVLAWYKQVVKDPILDMTKAWKEIGSHNFSRVYYVGALFEIFQYNYQLYHIFNTILKALAGLSFFPLIYILFKKRSLAFLATFLFSIHFSTFGSLNSVYIGKDALIIVSMNLFLAIYLWAARKHNFSLKIMFVLLMLLLIASYIDIPRFYPVLLLLPFLELLNLWLNRSSTTFKASILRLIFLYSPFIALVLYSPQAAITELNINKIKDILRTENFQVFIILFASFGSIFVPEGIFEQLNVFARVGNYALYHDFWTFLNFLLFRFLILSYPILFILGLLVTNKSKWFILRSLFLSISFAILAFLAANHWIYLDPKLRAAVDPGTYFIHGIVGLFVFSTSIALFIEWLKNKENYLLLTVSLAPIFSLLYIFFTWMLHQNHDVVFLGVHGYLSIPALGSSLYLVIIFYLAFQKLKFKVGILKRIVAVVTLIYFFLFLILNSIQIDKYYADWLLRGYAASDQKRIQDSFWKEVGLGMSKDKSPILVYLDDSKADGFPYAANFTWDIPPLLTIGKGLPFETGWHCKSALYSKDADKLRVEVVNGRKVIIQSSCGSDFSYYPENFFAFELSNRNLIPIKSKILKELGID